MDDIFGLYKEPGYTDIARNLMFLQEEVKSLDIDSLIDEISGLQYQVEGDDSDKISALIFKHHAEEELTEDEDQYLRNVYVLFYSRYGVLIDEPEDDDEV